jgi:K+-dependent Na+/Ca+ exchanger-like protein
MEFDFSTASPTGNVTPDEGCGTWDELWLPCLSPFSIAIVVEVLIFAYSFVGLAIVCDDYLVQSLETLCARWNIREDVAGASFVAFGSAAPEIIINSITTIKSAGSDTGAGADLGVSAIIGSGMIAFLLIPGCCGMFSTKMLPLKRRPLMRDSLTYAVALVILCIFMSNGEVELYEGLVLTGAYVIYIVVVYVSPTIRFKYRSAQAAKRGETIKRYESFVTVTKATTTGVVLSSGAGSMDTMDGFDAGVSSSTDGGGGSGDIVVGGGGGGEDDALGGSPTHSTEPLMVGDAAPFLENDDDMDTSLLAAMGDYGDNEMLLPGEHMDLASPTAAGTDDDTFLDPALICCHCLITGSVRNVTRNRAAGCKCFVKWVLTIVLLPLKVLFKYTCPPCELETRWERMYPVTFLISFIWVAIFSFCISTVVDQWVGLAPVDASYLAVIFGVILVAGGAEIPDTMQSVLYARQGYGSMAVSNCIGSQICNILLGLGLPWSISNFIGVTVRINNYQQIQGAALFQFGNVVLNFCVLVGAALVMKKNKAELGKVKGVFFFVMYLLVVGAFCAFTVLSPASNATVVPAADETTAAPLLVTV